MSIKASFAPLLALVGAGLLTSCVPVIPECDACGATSGAAPFPDLSQMDREAACELSEDPCGYPAGDGSYGQAMGDTFPNVQMTSCTGEAAELADHFQPRPDNMEYNKGVVFAIGAVWCDPCQDEAHEFAEIAPDRRGDLFEFIHLVAEHTPQGTIATQSSCDIWVNDVIGGDIYPVYFDAEQDDMNALLPMGSITPIPYTFFLDTNAQVRAIAQGTPNLSVIQSHIDGIVANPY